MKKNKHTDETPEKVQETAQNESVEKSTVENETDTNPLADDTTENSDTLEQQLAELSQKCADLNDKNLRLMAEFDNYRKRTLKERTDLIKTAGESLLSNMLPLVDDFERGLKAMETSEDVVAIKEGVDLIYTKFVAFLIQNGVKAISDINEVFDTDLHEAITTIPAPTEDLKGKIVDCVSKGYTLNEKVIRFSKVVVGE